MEIAQADFVSNSSDQRTRVMTNANMRVAEVRQFCELDDAGQQLVKAAMTQIQLSGRIYHSIPS